MKASLMQFLNREGAHFVMFRPFQVVLFIGMVVLTSVASLSTTRAIIGEADTTIYLPIVRRSLSTAGEGIGPLYGVNFITSAEAAADEQQFQNGLATGATWDRWPIYWPIVEQSEGIFNWSTQDVAVQGDLAHGLRTNAILLGTPSFYTTDRSQTRGPISRERPSTLQLYRPERATPVGLYEPVFTDGTDVPGPGKQINLVNVWARFVQAAVSRYKPGGILAQQNGWPAGVGITHWEMWNEPDLTIFWDSSLEDYARLLKVGYLAAKHADPQAQILFGALANNHLLPNYYEDVLSIYDSDPLAADHAYFHDILATHSYFQVHESWRHVFRARQTMAARGLDKPIWLNESGVPAWDDYPGPTWDPTSGLRATMSEQADYIIQSAFFAAFAGADAIFHFQLYDGCGNQPAGTNFPPHQGELCTENGEWVGHPGLPCAGDANGLFRNPTDAACFAQHLQPETPRPNFAAFRVLTTYLTNVEPLWRQRPGSDDPLNGPQEWIAFYQPSSGKRIVGMWARFGQAQTAVIEATNPAGTALLVAPDGSIQTVTAQDGVYIIPLAAATNQNAPWDSSYYPIGGRPVILIEPAAPE